MKQKKQYGLPWIWLLPVGILLAGAGCTKNYSSYSAQVQAPTAPMQPLADYLVNNYNFSLFAGALKRTGLFQQIVADTAQLTLLVPDNDAFARAGISADSLNAMDTAGLRQWMAYHIVQGAVTYGSVPQTIGNAYRTISGSTLYFGKPVRVPTVPVLHINGDTVNNFDLLASNGVIQVLNTPLAAPFAGSVQDYLSTPPFSLFKSTLQKAGLWDGLATFNGSQTIFAPTNDAYAQQYGFFVDSLQESLVWFLTQDSVNMWNTAHMPGDIFSAYILPSRIFSTDVTDAPLAYMAPYILPDGLAAVGLTGSNGAVSMGFTDIGNILTTDPYYYFAPGNASLIFPANVVTNNGVVQALSQLLIAPYTIK